MQTKRWAMTMEMLRSSTRPLKKLMKFLANVENLKMHFTNPVLDASRSSRIINFVVIVFVKVTIKIDSILKRVRQWSRDLIFNRNSPPSLNFPLRFPRNFCRFLMIAKETINKLNNCQLNGEIGPSVFQWYEDWRRSESRSDSNEYGALFCALNVTDEDADLMRGRRQTFAKKGGKSRDIPSALNLSS